MTWDAFQFPSEVLETASRPFREGGEHFAEHGIVRIELQTRFNETLLFVVRGEPYSALKYVVADHEVSKADEDLRQAHRRLPGVLFEGFDAYVLVDHEAPARWSQHLDLGSRARVVDGKVKDALGE